MRSWSSITSLCEAPLHVHSGQVLNNVTGNGQEQRVRTQNPSSFMYCSCQPDLFLWKCIFALHLCHPPPVLNNWHRHILTCMKGVAFSLLKHLTWTLKHRRKSSWIKHCDIKAQRECFLTNHNSRGLAVQDSQNFKVRDSTGVASSHRLIYSYNPLKSILRLIWNISLYEQTQHFFHLINTQDQHFYITH